VVGAHNHRPDVLPPLSTWYLLTNLSRPGSPRAATTPWAPAALEDLVRLYGLRLWVEQSYKQVKGQLGWADFQVRSDTAIQRHWQLVCCAFAFYWWVWFRTPEAQRDRFTVLADAVAADGPAATPATIDAAGRGGNRGRGGRGRFHGAAPSGLLARYAAPRPGLANALGAALALVASLVFAPAAPGAPSTA
jgi:hypothetical protein